MLFPSNIGMSDSTIDTSAMKSGESVVIENLSFLKHLYGPLGPNLKFSLKFRTANLSCCILERFSVNLSTSLLPTT